MLPYLSCNAAELTVWATGYNPSLQGYFGPSVTGYGEEFEKKQK